MLEYVIQTRVTPGKSALKAKVSRKLQFADFCIQKKNRTIKNCWKLVQKTIRKSPTQIYSESPFSNAVVGNFSKKKKTR